MNKSKIEWCDFTWNPVTGCLHGCPYCYARRMSERFGRSFAPEFHRSRMADLATVGNKPSSRIFICSMADLFGEWVPDEWIQEIRWATVGFRQHTFIYLTKNPKRLANINPEKWPYAEWTFLWRDNEWVGATVTDQETLPATLADLGKVKGGGARFISFEPLLSPIQLPDDAKDVLDWIIIGPQTGPGAPPADFDAIGLLVKQAQALGIPVFCKDSCGWWARYREFPR